MSPFTRAIAEWIVPIEITQNGYYPLQASEASSQVYKISQNFPDGEYLLIENRQPILWDADWDGGGVVIYHVDENKADQSTRGYPDHDNWPADHYMISVVQQDGNYGIETGESPGDASDFWTIDMVLSPGGDISTDAISSGTQVQTGITIRVRTVSQFIMSFQVEGL
jgi:immune inhibitor A